MDETAHAVKRGRGTWLHEAIAATTARVIGIDSSPEVPEAGLRTASNAEIQRGSVSDLNGWLASNSFVPEVVVAGELVEHLPNPLAFLRSLAAAERLKGCTLILTTPNSTAVHNVAIGILSRESTHHDHLCILSFKTLNTLCRRAGLNDFRIIPYRSAFLEMRERNPGFRGLVVAVGEAAVNVVEWLFPMLSFGYVVVANCSRRGP